MLPSLLKGNRQNVIQNLEAAGKSLRSSTEYRTVHHVFSDLLEKMQHGRDNDLNFKFFISDEESDFSSSRNQQNLCESPQFTVTTACAECRTKPTDNGRIMNIQ